MNRDYLAYLGAKQRKKEVQEEAAALEQFIQQYEKRPGTGRLRNVPRPASMGLTVGRTVPSRAKDARARKRKAMSAAQRQAVSARMHKYWAARRAAAAAAKTKS